MAGQEENTPRAMQKTSMRPPSRIPAALGLTEVTNSEHNSRAQTTLAAGNVSLKHKGSALPEPPSKKKPVLENATTPSKAPKSISRNGMPNGGTNGHLRGPPSTSLRNASSSSTVNNSTAVRSGSSMSTYKPISVLDHARANASKPKTTAQVNNENGSNHLDEPVTIPKRQPWDTKGRIGDMEVLYAELKQQSHAFNQDHAKLEDKLNLYKTRVEELTQLTTRLSGDNQTLSADNYDARSKLQDTVVRYEDCKRKADIDLEDLARQHRNDTKDQQDVHERELEQTRRDRLEAQTRLSQDHEAKLAAMSRAHEESTAAIVTRRKAELESEQDKFASQLRTIEESASAERQNLNSDAEKHSQELEDMQTQLQKITTLLNDAQALNNSLNSQLDDSNTHAATLDASLKAMKAKVDFLESDNQAQSQSFADLNQKMQDAVDRAAEANDKLRSEESLRRKLHNQIQELKGNIRVFCRIRPMLDSDWDPPAKILFPDSDAECREVAIQGPEQKSSLGNVTTATNGFTFDRIFPPTSQNEQVFDEISQLVQSALDGYNVCIFCYGQTGSGKTHTMSAADGMIPRAVTQMFESVSNLKQKGWEYEMQGNFIEVYNEMLNDLLGKADDWEKKKHEIKHDPQTSRTTVTDVETVRLDSPETIHAILERANRNRVVAATKANARSSRSHSVFILRLTGVNSVTGETSEGTLNLVDLAGSERLSHSGATGDRMKETQHINKSLSCLGDVIGALGQHKDGRHVPYRNSKLTYLLQYSLGGNSKTLMFVMISPLQVHLAESLTSLKFATKVHNTHIGTARKQTK